MLTSTILQIIASIIKQCMLLNKLGIQHTDLKPSNILINETTKEVTIIDYNICSIKSSGKTHFGWSFGIGTWCFCAPEIIYNEEPSDTSCMDYWSFNCIFIYWS
jgi:serine/threonine protein kinase